MYRSCTIAAFIFFSIISCSKNTKQIAIRKIESGKLETKIEGLYLFKEKVFNESSEISLYEIELLILHTYHESKHVRRSSLEILGFIQGDPGVVVPAIIRCLNDPENSVIIEALISLGHWSCTTPVEENKSNILIMLENNDADIRDKSIWLLSKLQSVSDTDLKLILRLLNDESPIVRRRLCWSLSKWTPLENDRIDILIELCDDDSAEVRCSAARHIRSFDRHIERLLPSLAKLIEDDAFSVSRVAVSTFNILRSRSPTNMIKLFNKYQAILERAIIREK